MSPARDCYIGGAIGDELDKKSYMKGSVQKWVIIGDELDIWRVMCRSGWLMLNAYVSQGLLYITQPQAAVQHVLGLYSSVNRTIYL